MIGWRNLEEKKEQEFPRGIFRSETRPFFETFRLLLELFTRTSPKFDFHLHFDQVEVLFTIKKKKKKSTGVLNVAFECPEVQFCKCLHKKRARMLCGTSHWPWTQFNIAYKSFCFFRRNIWNVYQQCGVQLKYFSFRRFFNKPVSTWAIISHNNTLAHGNNREPKEVVRNFNGPSNCFQETVLKVL